MNSEKVNAAISQLNEAQGSLRKHDAIRAIENGNYAEAIEILEDEGVDGYRGAVGSDQVRAIAAARKALYEALIEETPVGSIETEPVTTTIRDMNNEERPITAFERILRNAAWKSATELLTPEMIEKSRKQEEEAQVYHAMVDSVQSITDDEWREIEQWGGVHTYAEIHALVHLLNRAKGVSSIWIDGILLLKDAALKDGLVTEEMRLTEKGVKYAKYFEGILS